MIQVHQVRPFTNHYTLTLFHVTVAVHPTEVTRSNSDLIQSTAHCNIIAEPEGEVTNLDAQVAERLYICIYVLTINDVINTFCLIIQPWNV